MLRLPLPKQFSFVDDDFTDLGVKPEVFTKGKIPILVNWIFCLNKILAIEPKCTKPIVKRARNTSGILGMQFKVLYLEELHTFRRHFKKSLLENRLLNFY